MKKYMKKLFKKIKYFIKKILKIQTLSEEVESDNKQLEEEQNSQIIDETTDETIDETIDQTNEKIDESKPVDTHELPLWEREHIDDENVEVSPYIEVDIADPWKDYSKNAIKCLNGTFKEEYSVLPNDLVEFAGPMGDNIWLGKKEGEGYVILVGPAYTYDKQLDVYTVIKVKVYDSEKADDSRKENVDISYVS